MDKEIFVQNIKDYCALRGIKPTVACRESGVGSSFINNIESRGQVPSVEKVQLLAQYLGVTVSDLLGETPPEEQARTAFAEHLGKAAKESIATAEEQQLLEGYRSLNPQGQEYIRQTMHMAVQIYKKSSGLSKLEGQG